MIALAQISQKVWSMCCKQLVFLTLPVIALDMNKNYFLPKFKAVT